MNIYVQRICESRGKIKLRILVEFKFKTRNTATSLGFIPIPTFCSYQAQCPAIRERQLGAEHPDTLESLNNLATLYLAQGKNMQDEVLLVRVLTISERQLGPG